MSDPGQVARPTAFYPTADITPQEFEKFVAELLRSIGSVAGAPPIVTLHDKISGTDGDYDFDASARIQWAGMEFLVIVEAKLHKNPIKRELVQVLHDKLRSVGAQKAVMFSTAAYQSGALSYAKVHGIALARITEGRFIYHTRSQTGPSHLTREQARDLGDIPDFVAHAYTAGDRPDTTDVTLLSTESPDLVARVLLNLDPAN